MLLLKVGRNEYCGGMDLVRNWDRLTSGKNGQAVLRFVCESSAEG
jgi:hypothetical protein